MPLASLGIDWDADEVSGTGFDGTFDVCIAERVSWPTGDCWVLWGFDNVCAKLLVASRVKKDSVEGGLEPDSGL